jgi:hypothetical protein
MIFKDKFEQKLLDLSIPEREIVQQHIIHGNPFIFSQNEDLYFKMKKDISDYFKIYPDNVMMVGSAKLGFSISPQKLWKDFREESDIDAVIVSDKIFDLYWQDLFEFNIELTARSEHEQIMYNSFIDYFFRGWIRPDLFPFNFNKKDEWFTFFRNISYKTYGPQKITCAIYRNMFFFESYHVKNLKLIRNGLIK